MKPTQLSKEVVSLLEPRLSDEFAASHFYNAASNWCYGAGFKLAGAHYAKEAADELTHAGMIQKFMVDWNVIPPLPAIAKPQLEFKSLVEVVEKAYAMEYKLYEEYEDTSAKVFKTGDLCAFDFLQPLRSIQTKSVAEISDILNALEGVTLNKFELLVLEETLFEG